MTNLVGSPRSFAIPIRFTVGSGEAQDDRSGGQDPSRYPSVSRWVLAEAALTISGFSGTCIDDNHRPAYIRLPDKSYWKSDWKGR